MLKIYNADCLVQLKSMPDNSVDSCVCDPPYGISFMGRKWDYDVPSVEIWQQVLRVLKPGGHLLAFAGTRTQHRMAVRIEDAGFEIRDLIMWVYGSGFPKSLDVSKAIDKAAGAERGVVGQKVRGDVEKAKTSGSTYASAIANKNNKAIFGYGVENITAPATDAAKQWAGWGTALKPAVEPVTMARKPLAGTVAENVLQYGTGAINVDGCRVGTETITSLPTNTKSNHHYAQDEWTKTHIIGERKTYAGRWPANIIHDGSEEVVSLFPETTSGKMAAGTMRHNRDGWAGPMPVITGGETYGDAGSAARFFYCAKASKKDRGPTNKHPTVKPTDLMRYLCRLVTQPNGLVLDPFMGSGSTGKACVLEGFNFIGIEIDKEHYQEARKRILEAKAKKGG